MSRKNSDTRKRILESTWKLLESGTGGEVRMSDIAKEAGISRQALYLHFPNRADLLVATTRYLDQVKDIDTRLAASRAASTGRERLEAFIEAWGSYIPEIYGVAKALIAMQERDREARQAWSGRMLAVRQGCEVAVSTLDGEGRLSPELTSVEATDLLWTLLSVHNWQQLTITCGWPQERYVETMQKLAREMLISDH